MENKSNEFNRVRIARRLTEICAALEAHDNGTKPLFPNEVAHLEEVMCRLSQAQMRLNR